MTPELLAALQALATQYNVEIVGAVKSAGEGFEVKPEVA